MKIIISHFTILIGLSMTLVDSAVAEQTEISLQNVVESLQSIHAVQWQVLVKDDSSRREIRRYLNQIINSPGILRNLDRGSRKLI